MDSDTSKQVVLGGIRRQDEQGIEKKPVSKILPWLLLQFLPAGFCLELLPDFPQ